MSNEITTEFKCLLKDFLKDISRTFPEYNDVLSKYSDLEKEDNVLMLYEHVKMVYPERFFDILYKNEDIFKDNEKLDFLPNINFVEIWEKNISDNTKAVIWKYLQLILFSVSKGLEDGESFGDTAKLFEAIDEGDLKNKLEDKYD